MMIVKITVDDLSAHAHTKTFKIPLETTVEQLREKYLATNPLLPTAAAKHYALEHQGTFFHPEATLRDTFPHPSPMTQLTLALRPSAPLSVALTSQTRNCLDRLTAANKDLQMIDDHGRNLLHYFCMATTATPQLKILKFLLKKKLSPTLLDHDKKAPLFYAIEGKQLDVLHCFLKSTPEVFFMTNPQMKTPLHALSASEIPSIEKLSLIRKLTKTTPTHLRDRFGNFPLHEAASVGDSPLVSFFVKECGLSPHLRNESGETPLFVAAKSQNHSMVQNLLWLAPTTHFMTDRDGFFPFDIARKKGDEEMEKILQIDCVGWEVLVEITKENDVVMFAERFREIMVERGLLDRGGRKSVSIQKTNETLSNYASNCLCVAALRGKTSFMGEIIAKYSEFIKPNFLFCNRWSLCMCLASNSHLSTPSFIYHLTETTKLVSLYDKVDEQGSLILHEAILSGNTIAVHVLLSQAAPINHYDNEGLTELHKVVQTTDLRLARDLLSVGCDPLMRSLSGETPVDMAERLKHKEMLHLFHQHLGIKSDIKEEQSIVLPNSVEVEVVKALFVNPKKILNDKKGTKEKKHSLYCVLTHKLGPKLIKSEKSELVEPEDITKACETKYREIRANQGRVMFNPEALMLEMCKSGDLEMVRYLIEKRGISPTDRICFDQGARNKRASDEKPNFRAASPVMNSLRTEARSATRLTRASPAFGKPYLPLVDDPSLSKSDSGDLVSISKVPDALTRAFRLSETNRLPSDESLQRKQPPPISPRNNTETQRAPKTFSRAFAPRKVSNGGAPPPQASSPSLSIKSPNSLPILPPSPRTLSPSMSPLPPPVSSPRHHSIPLLPPPSMFPPSPRSAQLSPRSDQLSPRSDLPPPSPRPDLPPPSPRSDLPPPSPRSDLPPPSPRSDLPPPSLRPDLPPPSPCSDQPSSHSEKALHVSPLPYRARSDHTSLPILQPPVAPNSPTKTPPCALPRGPHRKRDSSPRPLSPHTSPLLPPLSLNLQEDEKKTTPTTPKKRSILRSPKVQEDRSTAPSPQSAPWLSTSDGKRKGSSGLSRTAAYALPPPSGSTERDFITKSTMKGDTPIEVAERYDRVHIIKYLISQGANASQSEHFRKLDNLIFNPVTRPPLARVTHQVQWKKSFTATFATMKNQSQFRELYLSFYESDPGRPEELNRFIGRAKILFDWSHQRRKDYHVTLLHPEGPIGEVDVRLKFKEVKEDLVSHYSSFDPLEVAKSLKKVTGKKKIARARYKLGARPNHPIVIVPGLASSALEAFATREKEWRRERVWIDPFKIGRLALVEKMAKVFGGGGGGGEKSDKNERDRGGAGFDDEIHKLVGEGETADKRRKWIEHMTLAADGFSDPSPDIKVRPVAGLHGIDYLASVSVAKAASYVFAHVIQMLIDMGYDESLLDACPYDWRLPPEKLHERDNYFGKMQKKIEGIVEHLDKKVVLMGHSMGNRVVQYFLKWVKLKMGQQWIDDHIYAFLAMGPPFLGSAKALRTVLCGDAMGLEIFLTKDEALYMARVSASLPWLFPNQETSYPDVIIRTATDGGSSENGSVSLPYAPLPWTKCLLDYVPKSLRFYEQFYVKNELFLKPKGENQKLVPLLEAPPVKRIWVLNGVNRLTEVGYYLRANRPSLDPLADKYSGKKLAGINPRGLLIVDGISFETPDTFQPSIKGTKSGDGTVPYCSLNYAEVGWVDETHVYTIEIEDAEHREMLASDAVFNEIISLVCK